MLTSHPEIEMPPDNSMIWRYLDIERLLTMLNDKALFLCRLDNFRDPWEGSWPQSVIDGIRTHWPADSQRFFTNTSINVRRFHFVNCWYESPTESAELWDLYAANSGVAIQSTIGLLKSSITDEKDYFVGRVRYVNFEIEPSPSLNLLVPPFLKRKSFEHEREVRVLHWGLPHDEKGIQWEQVASHHKLSIDPNILIERLHVSPSSPEWLFPAIREFCVRFQISAPVVRSSLYDPRVY